MVKEEVRNLSFLFTETGFVLDTVDREQQDSKWFQRFQEDKYSALYDFGFQERIHQLHASTGFLHRTAELYIHVLTSLSELEIAREQVQITLPVDIWEQLQKELLAVSSLPINGYRISLFTCTRYFAGKSAGMREVQSCILLRKIRI